MTTKADYIAAYITEAPRILKNRLVATDDGVNHLPSGYVYLALPCDCAFPNCKGWMMVRSNERKDIACRPPIPKPVELRPHIGKSAADTFRTQRRGRRAS